MDADTSPTLDTVDAVDARRSRLAIAFLVGSGVLLLAGVLGHLDPLGLVWVDRLLDHPFVFGSVAAACFGYGLALLVRRLWVALLLATPCLVVAFGWAAIGVSWSYLFGFEEIAAVSAPDGDGADFEAVVAQRPDGVDHVWIVSVRQTGSPLAREWEVGCLTQDPTHAEPIAWTGRDEFVMTTDGGRVPVGVDARTGRPAAVDGYPWDECGRE